MCGSFRMRLRIVYTNGTCVYLTWRALSQFYENVRSRTSRGLLSDFSQVNESAVWYPTNALWDISFLRKPAYSRVKFEIACSSNWTLMNLMRLLRTGSHFKHSIRRSQIQRNFFFFPKAEVIDPVLRDLHPDLLFFCPELANKRPQSARLPFWGVFGPEQQNTIARLCVLALQPFSQRATLLGFEFSNVQAKWEITVLTAHVVYYCFFFFFLQDLQQVSGYNMVLAIDKQDGWMEQRPWIRTPRLYRLPLLKELAANVMLGKRRDAACCGETRLRSSEVRL